jgi:hypothetical protein
MKNNHGLREIVSVLLSRIDDFLAFSEDLQNLPPGSYPEDDYLRLLVPLNSPIERLHSEFKIMEAETASGPALLHGDEDEASRGVALLKKTLEEYWISPCVAGSIGAVIISRFNVPLLVTRFSGMRPRLLRVQQLLNDPEQWSDGRMKRRWLSENPELLPKQFENLRINHPDRVRDAGGGGRGPWQFTKTLCKEFGLNCPEFSESSP